MTCGNCGLTDRHTKNCVADAVTAQDPYWCEDFLDRVGDHRERMRDLLDMSMEEVRDREDVWRRQQEVMLQALQAHPVFVVGNPTPWWMPTVI